MSDCLQGILSHANAKGKGIDSKGLALMML